MNPITLAEQDVADFLLERPEFFTQNPELLSALQLPHPINGGAISLIERQSMVLRERIKTLEARLAELIHHGQNNDAIADKLTDWSRQLLLQTDAAAMPELVVEELKRIFGIPYGAVRLWRVTSDYLHLPAASIASEDVAALANSMLTPYCGANVGFDAANWLTHNTGDVQSLAMLPLRGTSENPSQTQTPTFGLVVLGSPDKNRFHPGMDTVFLRRMTELASAALVRLTR